MKYPATPPNLLPDTPVVLRALTGCLIAIGVAAVVVVIVIVIAIWLALNASSPQSRESKHNAEVLYSAFTGQRPSSSIGAGGENGPEAHAVGLLQGHPTPREERARAIEAFTATGYTPTIDTTPRESWCSLATYPPTAYLPGAVPLSVSVICTLSAKRSPYSTASIVIEVSVPTVDLRPTLDSRGYLEPSVGLVEDLPLYNAYVDVSAST